MAVKTKYVGAIYFYYADQQMHNIYINNILYTISTSVSMHLHHLQGVSTLFFAKVIKLLKLQHSKINKLKCSCERS
jgi:hypothetical protein